MTKDSTADPAESPVEDETLDHGVPADLRELHEIIEWQQATGEPQ